MLRRAPQSLATPAPLVIDNHIKRNKNRSKVLQEEASNYTTCISFAGHLFHTHFLFHNNCVTRWSDNSEPFYNFELERRQLGNW